MLWSFDTIYILPCLWCLFIFFFPFPSKLLVKGPWVSLHPSWAAFRDTVVNNAEGNVRLYCRTIHSNMGVLQFFLFWVFTCYYHEMHWRDTLVEYRFLNRYMCLFQCRGVLTRFNLSLHHQLWSFYHLLLDSKLPGS